MYADSEIRIFPSPSEMAEKFAGELALMISSAGQSSVFNVALAGGSTPGLLYSVIGDHFSSSVPWERVGFYWGDERCVLPDDPQSNYGLASRTLLMKIGPVHSSVHRIMGENKPEAEAERYSELLKANLPNKHGLPNFDLVLLGLGEDGHTASIFPDQIKLMHSSKLCDVAHHPASGQKRITLTGPVLNNAAMVVFLVTGSKKAAIVRKILENAHGSENFPAAGIVPSHGKMIWLLDREASSELKM